jgi:pSer/pThr/pTyr-binding forkhead associated (FHA) protein
MKRNPEIRILVLSGPYKNHRFIVKSDAPFLIGRLDNSAIKITYDKYCSRKHAAIFMNNGQCIIEDLGSSNGTYINDVRICKAAILRSKDIVRIGQTRMQVFVINRPDK